MRPGNFPRGLGGPYGSAEDTLGERKLRIDSINNLKQIALAFHNYHDTYDGLPADITDDEGRPLLSWRVAILPYIEQGHLYNQFKLDESWDSPNNKKLLSKMPQIYRYPGEGGGIVPGGATYYQGFSGKWCAFRPGKPPRINDFPDKGFSTILIVEAANAVPWTKPQDLPYSPRKPIPALGMFPDVIHAAFVDGSVHNLRPDFDENEMRKAILRNAPPGETVAGAETGGKAVDLAKLELPRTRPGAGGGAPGMPGMGGPMRAGMPGGPGRPPGMGPNVPSNPKLDKLRDENAKLQSMLFQTKEEMQSLRQEMEQLKQQSAQKRQEQVEADQLLAEREMLKQQIEQAAAELKAMRDELQRLKRGQDKE